MDLFSKLFQALSANGNPSQINGQSFDDVVSDLSGAQKKAVCSQADGMIGTLTGLQKEYERLGQHLRGALSDVYLKQNIPDRFCVWDVDAPDVKIRVTGILEFEAALKDTAARLGQIDADLKILAQLKQKLGVVLVGLIGVGALLSCVRSNPDRLA